MSQAFTQIQKQENKPLNIVIVGGGRGCESFLRMIEGNRLGRWRFSIRGVADIDPKAPGLLHAHKIEGAIVTSNYRDLFNLPELDLIIELTGDIGIRDELERERPRHVPLIDHFGASLFWELFQAEEAVIRHKNEARERVEKERNWFSQIFDSLPDEIVVVDLNMRIQDANAGFLKNNSYTIQEVVGRHCYDVEQNIRGECQVAVGNCPFSNVLNTRQTITLVRKHFDKDGNRRYATIVAAPLIEKDGTVSGMIESTRDITQRIQLDQQLKATEIQLHQFMESAPMATYIKTPRGVYEEVNPAACTLYGRSKNEILGRSDLEILDAPTAEIIRHSDRTVLETRKEITLEEQMLLNGREVYLSTVKYPVLDENGAVTAVCGIMQDVTDFKLAEIELKSTRDYLQNILDHSPIIIITTDLQNRIVQFNPGAQASLGYSQEDVFGKPVWILYHTKSERESLLRRVKNEGTVADYETKLIHKDGHDVSVTITLSQLKDEDGNMIGTVGACRDITHRKALINQIMQSERLAAVGRLAAGVAHEINNPLAVIGEISGYLSELLEDDPLVNQPDTLEELNQSLPKIRAQVRRCRDITHRLLSFARKSEARVEEADVNASLDEILTFWDKEVRLGRIIFHRNYDPALPKVCIEEMQLQEIFINIIHNSIQAIENDSGNIWITTSQHDGKVTISIRDDGPGIPAELLDKLFDPFVSTKAPGQGTGLGLSICYGIVKRYDGEIRVSSELGWGATFKVILPIAKADKKKSCHSDPSEQQAGSNADEPGDESSDS